MFVAQLVSPVSDCGPNTGGGFKPILATFTHIEPEHAGICTGFAVLGPAGQGRGEVMQDSAELYFTVLPSGF